MSFWTKNKQPTKTVEELHAEFEERYKKEKQELFANSDVKLVSLDQYRKLAKNKFARLLSICGSNDNSISACVLEINLPGSDHTHYFALKEPREQPTKEEELALLLDEAK